ncbi:MAG TPA: sigma-70 family RNA polymerase sigma factor [Acidimicrobiia bacterium]
MGRWGETDVEPGATVEELVVAARRGERAAFAGLYTVFAAQVAGYVRGFGVPDPDDTVGEVFVSVIRNIDRFEGNGDDFRRWLFTIAYRRAMDAHRQQFGRPEDPTDPGDVRELREASIDDLADRVVDRIHAGSQLQDAIDRLTDEQRAVILLRIVSDFSVADTAVILRKRPGAVKTLQRRALAALRRHLGSTTAVA